MNMDRMTEDEIMIAELERIIRAEKAKPDGERDAQLIDDCIKEMAEIKGVRAEYSQEEVAEITEKLIRDTEREKAKRKKLVRRVAGIAAAFAVVIGASACAFNPALINWIVTVFKMNNGSVVSNKVITYINQGKESTYDNLESLISSEMPDVLFPRALPENIDILEINSIYINGNRVIHFVFNDTDLSFTIQYNDAINIDEYNNEIMKINLGDTIVFSVYPKSNYFIAYSSENSPRYCVESRDIESIKTIINGLERIGE